MAGEEKQDDEEEKIEELELVEEVKPRPEARQADFTWTPEIVRDIGKFLLEILGKDLADKLLTYRKNEAESRRHYFETVSRHNRNMVYILIIFLSVIVGFMSLLTRFGLVSGDALLFLVGTITGYVLLFIQRLVFPSEPTPIEEETTA